MPTETIKPYTDVPFAELGEKENSRYGSDFFRDVAELQVGAGSTVFRADEQGIWLGAEQFASAPFRVDMQGNLVANSVTLSGYLQVGEALGDVQDNITGLSQIESNLGSITAGTITGVTITGGTLQTATSGRRVKISSSPANKIEFYDSSTLYGVLEADRVGTDGYINLVAQDEGAGLSIYTGVGASLFSSISIFSNGGSFDSSGNASNGFQTITGKYGGYFQIYGDGSAVDRISTDLRVENSWLPHDSATYDLGSTTYKWRDGHFSRDVFVGDDLDVTDNVTIGGDMTLSAGEINLTNGSLDIAAGFVNLARMSGTTADARVDDEDGSMYYRTDDDVIRVKLNGSWKTITTS